MVCEEEEGPGVARGLQGEELELEKAQDLAWAFGGPLEVVLSSRSQQAH